MSLAQLEKETMHPKTARSHARSYMQSNRTRQDLDNFYKSDRYKALIRAYSRSSYSKRPGRLLKRLTKALGPGWMDLQIDQWARRKKIVRTQTLTYDANAVIEIQDDYTKHSFRDDLLQSNTLILDADPFFTRTYRGASVSMTLHAITRILERKGCDPVDIGRAIPDAMRLACHIVWTGFSKSYPSATNSFLIPFLGGALVAINCPVFDANDKITTNEVDGLSIRTWLTPEMLKEQDMARMVAMQTFLDATYHDGQVWDADTLQNCLEEASVAYSYRHSAPAMQTQTT